MKTTVIPRSPVDSAEKTENDRPVLDVDVRRRLVAKEDPGGEDEGPGNRNALRLAAGEMVGLAAANSFIPTRSRASATFLCLSARELSVPEAELHVPETEVLNMTGF